MYQKTDDDVFPGVDEGGWMIEYKDEDPEIRKRYQAALKANGVVSSRPVPVVPIVRSVPEVGLELG